ncbi:MAG: PASTA domain-containing protein [Actinobacteria bacterium]|nr:PASTA domain-containing protein [Actinomycetota bacterium]
MERQVHNTPPRSQTAGSDATTAHGPASDASSRNDGDATRPMASLAEGNAPGHSTKDGTGHASTNPESGSTGTDSDLSHDDILVEDLAAEGAFDHQTGTSPGEDGEPHWETQLFETATVANGVRELGGGSVRMVTLGIFALAAAIALVLYFANAASEDVARNSVDRTAPLPDLVGDDESAAAETLDAMGVNLDVERRPHAVVPAGKITEQDPEVGARVARGETVTLVVSSGPAERLVPDGLIGADRASSVRFVSELGIDTDVVKMYSTKTPAGLVAATVPKEGEPLLKDQTLELQLSIGPAPVRIPSVINRQYGQGEEMLKRAGFDPQKVLLPNPTAPPGTIFSLSRTPGHTAPDGSRIQVFVSRGPAKNVQVDPKLAPIAPRTYLVPPTLPPVLVDPNATTVPAAPPVPTPAPPDPANTAPTTAPPAVTPPAPAPTPTTTAPPAPPSTPAPNPGTVAIPNVVGAIDVIARPALEAMGFQVVIQNNPNGNMALNHQVIAQSPAAGTQVPPGTAVTLTVAIFQAGV